MKIISALILLCTLLPLKAWSQTQYELKWDAGKLPFEIKTAQGPLNIKNRVGQMGTVSESLNLPIQKQMPDGKILLNRSESGYVYLFIKNKSKKTYKISVAPHSTHPGESALGFVFNCLCNGHVYTVEPNTIWYRIMELKNFSGNTAKSVELMHHIFEVK